MDGIARSHFVPLRSQTPLLKFMSDLPADAQDNSELPAAMPADLPPVEPPSAKFIIQLFVVPGLIVAAIVGVWLLFGKLASAEQDWQALLADMKSSNEHRRGRGAMGLAQALAADQNRKTDGPRLATNPQVAQELANFLAETLKNSSSEPAVIAQQDFLTRTLGYLDTPQFVLPVLSEAMQESRDHEVREKAVISVARIAHRASERREPLSDQGIIEALTSVSRDSDPLMRSMATFALGFFPLDLVRQPLTVLLADLDANTRANAAVAFARHKSLDGLAVFRDVLKSAAATKTPLPPGDSAPIATTAALKAVGDLAPLIEEPMRAEIRREIDAISTGYPDAKIRFDAAQTLAKLRDSGK